MSRRMPIFFPLFFLLLRSQTNNDILSIRAAHLHFLRNLVTIFVERYVRYLVEARIELLYIGRRNTRLEILQCRNLITCKRKTKTTVWDTIAHIHYSVTYTAIATRIITKVRTVGTYNARIICISTNSVYKYMSHDDNVSMYILF